MKKCFFIGHREIGEEILPILKRTILHHINELGVTEFIVGNYGGFDRMAASAVVDIKKDYPDVKLTMLLPYHPTERRVEKPNGFDDTYYPWGLEKVPRRFAIVYANRHMIDYVDCLIACVRYNVDNSCKLLEYAKRKTSLHITNIGEEDLP